MSQLSSVVQYLIANNRNKTNAALDMMRIGIQRDQLEHSKNTLSLNQEELKHQKQIHQDQQAKDAATRRANMSSQFIRPDGTIMSAQEIGNDPRLQRIAYDFMSDAPQVQAAMGEGNRFKELVPTDDGTGYHILMTDKDGIERVVTNQGQRFLEDGDAPAVFSQKDVDDIFQSQVGYYRAGANKLSSPALMAQYTVLEGNNPSYRNGDDVLTRIGGRQQTPIAANTGSSIPDDALVITEESAPDVPDEANYKPIEVPTAMVALDNIDRALPSAEGETVEKLMESRKTMGHRLTEQRKVLEARREFQQKVANPSEQLKAAMMKTQQEINFIDDYLQQNSIQEDPQETPVTAAAFVSKDALAKEVENRSTGPVSDEQMRQNAQQILDPAVVDQTRQSRRELAMRWMTAGHMKPEEHDSVMHFVNTGKFKEDDVINMGSVGSYVNTGYVNGQPQFELINKVNQDSLTDELELTQEEIETHEQSINFLRNRVASLQGFASLDSIEDEGRRRAIIKTADLLFSFTEGEFSGVLGADVTDTLDVNLAAKASDLYYRGMKEYNDGFFNFFDDNRRMNTAADAIGGAIFGYHNGDAESMFDRTDELAKLMPNSYTPKQRMNAYVVAFRTKRLNPGISDKKAMKKALDVIGI